MLGRGKREQRAEREERSHRRNRELEAKVLSRFDRTFRTFPTLLRRVAGMPDYQRHLEHLRRYHPGRSLPTEKEYYEEFLAARYQDGPTRCC
jgi:uncharacterized short protein YbdD (DUF466 family)